MYVRQAYRYKCGVAERAVSDLVSRLAFAPSGDGIVCVLCPQARFARPRLNMVGPLRGRWLCVSACRVCLPVLSPPYIIYVFTAMPACHAEGCRAAPRCLTAGERREPADADALLLGWGFGEVQYPYAVGVDVIRPLRGRDSVCPLSAGSRRSPAVRHGFGLFEAVGLVAFRYTFIIYKELFGGIPPHAAGKKAGAGMTCPRMSPPVPVWIVRNGCGWIPTARRRPHSGLRPCLIEIAGIVLQKEEHRQDPIPNKTH